MALHHLWSPARSVHVGNTFIFVTPSENVPAHHSVSNGSSREKTASGLFIWTNCVKASRNYFSGQKLTGEGLRAN